MAAPLSVEVEFGGGAELLFNGIKKHQVTLPGQEEPWDIRSLLVWIKKNLLKERPELFIQGDSVASWTTSCKTRTASSSYPHCTAAEGPARRPGSLGVGNGEQSDIPWGPASRSPCPLWPLSSLLCPPSSLQAGKRGQVLKMSLSQAREWGWAGSTLPPSPAAEVGEGVPLVCHNRRGLRGQVTQLPLTPCVSI
ncbi:ubiquitin-related modifier 1 isoform X1 [Suricata suricatta]|uniref:ubiquitin-related modifier 1 isoform X1 n=1 Tax=Suricata suricatta TaxID=37032 RepID=UPI001155BF52|nr:ubiquitin-related modifier 1 isoform X1 [Suricata suricatta]